MDNSRKIYEGNKKANILLDLGFKRFTLDTIDRYRTYLGRMNGPTGSYMRVANIICWGFYTIPYYIEMNGFFIIISDDAYYKTFSVLAPVGDYSNVSELEEVLKYICTVCDKLDVPLNILQVKDWMKGYLGQIDSIHFEYDYDDGESDYLYSLEALEESLSRRKMHYDSKIQKLFETYNPIVDSYKKEDYESCMKIIELMYCNNGGCKQCVFGCMKKFYDTILESLEGIDGEFLVIRSKDEVIAFIVFVNDEDLLYFDRKAPHNILGISEFINKLIIDRYSNRYRVMNFEEDMGNEGLRRHKKALGPYELSRNYQVELKVKNV